MNMKTEKLVEFMTNLKSQIICEFEDPASNIELKLTGGLQLAHLKFNKEISLKELETILPAIFSSAIDKANKRFNELLTEFQFDN